MIVAIHQPNYLPWMGYFDKMAKADVFVILDDVQLPRGGHCYETRATIATSAGPLELNIPVEGRGQSLIKDTRLAPGRWREKHLKSIQFNYRHPLIENLGELYRLEWGLLRDFNVALIWNLARWLGIQTKIILSSNLNVDAQGAEKILGIVQSLGADTYISGTGVGSRRYVSEELFQERGIKLVWHNYSGPNLSAIHFLFAAEAMSA